jgi:hypothetical protein
MKATGAVETFIGFVPAWAFEKVAGISILIRG